MECLLLPCDNYFHHSSKCYNSEFCMFKKLKWTWIDFIFCPRTILFCLFVCFVFFSTELTACGDIQARVKWELQLLVYTTATAMQDPSRVCDLLHSSWQHQILNPPSKARDRTCVLMDASQIRFPWTTTGTPRTTLKTVSHPKRPFFFPWHFCLFCRL